MRRSVWVEMVTVCSLFAFITVFLLKSKRQQNEIETYDIIKENKKLDASKAKEFEKVSPGRTSTLNNVYDETRCHSNRDKRRVLMRVPLALELNEGQSKRYCQRLPHVLLIGAGKCGTAALASYLNLSKSLEIAPGEIDYFSYFHGRGLDWYIQYMPETDDNQLGMEKSPSYMWHNDVPARVHQMNSTIKILVSLCDPVKRLVSRYVHKQYWTNYMTLPPLEDIFVVDNQTGNIIQEHPLKTRVPLETTLLEGSQYVTYMRRWLSYFKRSQFYFVNGEHLVKSPQEEMSGVAKFLGVKPFVTNKSVYFDKSKGFYCYTNEAGSKWCLNSEKGRKHPNVHTYLLKALRNYYIPYNNELYSLIGKRFDWPTYKMDTQQ